MDMIILIQLISIISSIISAHSCFNNDDVNIVSSMIEHHKMEQYILVSMICNSPTEISSQLKSLSKKNLLGIYLNFNNLMKYLESASFSDLKTIIVIKVVDNTELKKVMEDVRVQISENIFLRFTWMMSLPDNAMKITSKIFHIPFNCQFYLVLRSRITQIYQIKKGSSMIHLPYANRNAENGLSFNEQYISERRRNMDGQLMLMQKTYQELCRIPTECMQLEMWHDMGTYFNFTTKIVEKADVNVTIKPDTTSEMGVLHTMVKNKGNIIGPLLSQYAHMYIKDTNEHMNNWDSYLKPFSSKLWQATIFCICISSIVIVVVGWTALIQLKLSGYSLFDHALTPFSAFCNQGTIHLPTIASSRLARITAYFASAVIFPAYSAGLVSYLTVYKPKIPFTDLETFVQDGSYILAPLYTHFHLTYFLGDQDAMVKIIREKYLLPPKKFPKRHIESIEMICEYDKLCVINYNYRMLQLKAPCRILLVSDVIFNLPSGIILLNEGLNYKKLFLDYIIRFRSAGILKRMQIINDGKTRFEMKKDFEEITEDTTNPVLVLLLISMIISVLLFFLELLNFHIKRRLGLHCKGK